MSRRHAFARTITAVAIAAVGLGIGTGVAHAKEFGSEPSATAVRECETIPNSPIIGNSWNYVIANAANAPQDASFTVTVDNFPPQDYTIAPGASHAGGFSPKDGLPSHITIVADGQTVLEQTITLECNKPFATIEFSCKGGPTGTDAMLWHDVTNWSSKPVTWVEHLANGSVYTPPGTGQSGSSSPVAEDTHYDVTTTANGKVLASASGFANCHPDPTTTTTTTAPPATTTTVATADTTAPSTSTTVIAAEATAPTLPMTGGSTLPLGIAGGVMLAAGAALLVSRRRLDA